MIEHGCVPIKFYLWTLKLKFHRILTYCNSFFDFCQWFKSEKKPSLSLWTIHKQWAWPDHPEIGSGPDQTWPVYWPLLYHCCASSALLSWINLLFSPRLLGSPYFLPLSCYTSKPEVQAFRRFRLTQLASPCPGCWRPWECCAIFSSGGVTMFSRGWLTCASCAEALRLKVSPPILSPFTHSSVEKTPQIPTTTKSPLWCFEYSLLWRQKPGLLPSKELSTWAP